MSYVLDNIISNVGGAIPGKLLGRGLEVSMVDLGSVGINLFNVITMIDFTFQHTVWNGLMRTPFIWNT